MNSRIKLAFILVGLLSSLPASACSQLESSSDRLTCQKAAEEESKSKMQKVYSELYGYLSDIDEYQIQITRSQELWNQAAAQNCNVYAYFVEEGTMVHNITVRECMTEEYKNREKFLTHLRTVIDQFY
ncbi:lysozyme inhibitor LprI family protein [Vibrio salilacus]|uniref:lysozyme inhibitor LprI family protein n=1 Tax=Vibrio salilacus TaxID=1323749 RepID=UPI000C29F21E|nr:lysozyme inhibitor LprI family protein [Vibrio salilacus]